MGGFYQIAGKMTRTIGRRHRWQEMPIGSRPWQMSSSFISGDQTADLKPGWLGQMGCVFLVVLRSSNAAAPLKYAAMARG